MTTPARQGRLGSLAVTMAALAVAGALMTACGDETATEGASRRSGGDALAQVPSSPAPPATPQAGGPKKPKPGQQPASPPSPGQGGTNGGGTGGMDDGADDSGTDGGADGGGTLTGEDFFDRTIVKLMNAQCVTCHADPRQTPPVRGPLTIFSYQTMKGFLAGASASDNGLLRKPDSCKKSLSVA